MCISLLHQLTLKLKQMKKGILIENQNNCQLRVELTEDNTTYIWSMYSEKTGTHAINVPFLEQTFNRNRPFPTKRVRAHWEGFQQNQNR